MTVVRSALRGIENLVSRFNCDGHLLNPKERGEEEDCGDVWIERKRRETRAPVSERGATAFSVAAAAVSEEDDDATGATGEATVAISNGRSIHHGRDNGHRKTTTTVVVSSNRLASRRQVSQNAPRNAPRNAPQNESPDSWNEKSTGWTDAIWNQTCVEIIETKNADFAEKRQFLRHKCDALRSDADGDGSVRIDLESGSILEGSLDQVMQLSRREVRAKWKSTLDGDPPLEEDEFAGNWFKLVMNQMCDANYGLWRNGANGDEGMCLHINPWSGTLHPNHLSYFHFMGRLMGKALLEDHQVAYHMTPHIYKCLVGADFTMDDVEVLDPRYFRTMQQLDQVPDFDTLCLNFTTTEEVPFGGGTREVELVAGGADIMVTERNLSEYKEALKNYLLIGRVKEQLRIFLLGVDDAIPLAYLSVFKAHEMEVLMCGSLGESHLE